MAPRITGLVLLGVSAALGQDSDDHQQERLNWFYGQRAYPTNSIPAGVRRRAILELDRIDAAARAQRQAARGIAQGALPFSLTTDAINWRQLGPAPTRYNNSTYLTSGRINAIAIDPRDSNVVY
ncbi:MAG TPA: hypothetical protein VKE70_15915, partial [Candidatus Solibacter sp.]|nr:hypothetical protein [Candidatus Solibacter sp.]